MSRPSVSTTTGDKGTTSLFGGKRVHKDDDRVHAYGDVDELNAILGIVLSEKDLPDTIRTQLTETQRTLFTLGADLATPLGSDVDIQRISEAHIQALEDWGARLEKSLPETHHFLLPSGSAAGSDLHLARTVCRRAERWIITTAAHDEINTFARIYINRLSDYLFLAARTVNVHLGKEETPWIPE